MLCLPIDPHLMRNGMNIRRVQLLLGHNNLNTIQVYLQFRDEDLRDVYNIVKFEIAQ